MDQALGRTYGGRYLWWSRFAVTHGGPTLQQPFPEGLHPVQEDTWKRHTGAGEEKEEEGAAGTRC